MRVLLDTHIFLWTVMDSPLLKSPARRFMNQADQVYVSAASIWEIAVKARLGKIEADPAELADAIVVSGFKELPIRVAHGVAVANLPPHHTDPFDRMLIAQAIFEPLKLLTVDKTLAQYGEMIVLA